MKKVTKINSKVSMLVSAVVLTTTIVTTLPYNVLSVNAAGNIGNSQNKQINKHPNQLENFTSSTKPSTSKIYTSKLETISKISKDSFTIGKKSYKFSKAFSGLFGNTNALKKARVQFTYDAKGNVVNVLLLELNTAGKASKKGEKKYSSNIVFDAKKSNFNGTLRVNADFVTLKNITISKNLEITSKVKSVFYTSKVIVKGKTTVIGSTLSVNTANANSTKENKGMNSKFYNSLSIVTSPIKAFGGSGANTNTVQKQTVQLVLVFEGSKLARVEIKASNTSVNATGNTTVGEVALSSNASLSTDNSTSFNKVSIENGTNNVNLNGNVGTVTVKSSSPVSINGEASVNSISISANGSDVQLNVNGTVQTLSVSGQDSSISVGEGTNINQVIVTAVVEINSIEDLEKLVINGNVKSVIIDAPIKKLEVKGDTEITLGENTKVDTVNVNGNVTLNGATESTVGTIDLTGSATTLKVNVPTTYLNISTTSPNVQVSGTSTISNVLLNSNANVFLNVPKLGNITASDINKGKVELGKDTKVENIESKDLLKDQGQLGQIDMENGKEIPKTLPTQPTNPGNTGDQTGPSANQLAANAVTTKIVALPAVENITLVNELAVFEANTAFYRLPAAQKALVSTENQTKLTNAFAKIIKLKSADLFPSSNLTVWDQNDDENYGEYQAGSILQYNVNFKEGEKLCDFSSAEVVFYVENQEVGKNTVKSAAFTDHASAVGLTGLITAGRNDAEPDADPFWNIGAYSSDKKPTKAVFKLVKDGVSYEVTANFTPSTVQIPNLITSPTLTVWDQNDDENYGEYQAGSILQYNVNFKEGEKLSDFSSAEVVFYVENQEVGKNTVKSAAFTDHASAVGLTGLITAGRNDAEPDADPFWNIGAYSSDKKPTKAVFKLVKDGVSYEVTANFTPSTVQIPDLITSPTLTVWEGNDDEDYTQGSEVYPAGSILQYNVNFKNGVKLSDFSSAEVKFYVGEQEVGKNTVKSAAFSNEANAVGLTGLITAGPNSADSVSDEFWNIGEYTSNKKPTKAIYKLVKDGVVYEVTANFTPSTVQIPDLITSPTLTMWEGNDDEDYTQGSEFYPSGSILLYNVNFKNGVKLSDFSSAEVKFYVGEQEVGKNTVKSAAFSNEANAVGLSGLITAGPNSADSISDEFWNIGEYTSNKKPTKAVFKLVKDGVVYEVIANFTPSTIQIPNLITSPTLTIWDQNDDEEYNDGQTTYQSGSIMQYNVNFKSGVTLGDFSNATVDFYVDETLVGTNTVKSDALVTYSTAAGLTGLITAGPYDAESNADSFWDIGAYISDKKPTKAVFKLVKDGVIYEVMANYVESSITSTTINDFNFETIYSTQPTAISMEMPTDKNFFVNNPKEFTVSNGTRVVTIKIDWPMVYGDPEMNMANNQADIISSIFNSYFQGDDLIATASSLNDNQVILQGFSVGSNAKLIIGGNDKGFFFQNTDYVGTDDDTSNNGSFIISDGTNNLQIQLDSDYTNIEGLVKEINRQLKSASVKVDAFAEKVNDSQFKIVSKSADKIINISGDDQTQIFGN